MNKIIFSPEAKQDLDDIVDYIAQFNLYSAEKAYRKIKETIQILKEYREAGVKKPEITNLPLRFGEFFK